jgi:hypothetical protein
VERRARIEFDILAVRLREAGVDLIIFEDKEELHTPDAVFPNNWISFHEDGTVVLYPMFAPSRRPERRRDVIEKLEENGFLVTRTLDLTHHENDGRFLEGTGSVVFDYVHRRAYANLSPRTDTGVLQELCRALNYDPITFRAVHESGGDPIHHTDMIMAIAERFVIFCPDAVGDFREREMVIDTLSASGRELIAIDRNQLRQFAGNVLQLQTKDGLGILAISTSACLALHSDQRARIEKYLHIIESPLPIFESIGGGSARCMMADVHLPRR